MSVAPHPSSTRLRAAGALVGLQALAVAVLAAVVVYEDVTAEVAEVGIALGVTAFVVLIAGVLGAIAWSLAHGRPGARGPAIAIELLLLAPAYFMINGGAAMWGWPLAAVCAAVIALLFIPPAAR